MLSSSTSSTFFKMESTLGNSNRPRRSVCTPTYGDHEYSFLDGSDIDITPDEEEEEYFPERLGGNFVESEESDDDVPLANLLQPKDTGSPSSDSDDEPLSKLVCQSSAASGSTKKNAKKTLPPWVKQTVFEPSFPEFPNTIDDYENRRDWDVIAYFKQYIDESIFEQLSFCTNQQYVQATGSSLKTTPQEIAVFVGVSLVASVLKYPRLRMYWAKHTRISMIADAISRNRYFVIRSHLKIVNDILASTVDRSDRLWKVKPLLERVRAGCLKLARPPCVAIDEQMIPFTGKTVLRQYIPRKPTPEGLKNFVLASPNGLILDFVLYQGKGTFPDGLKIFGVGGAAVMFLCTSLHEGTRVYFDRFFTTVTILDELRKKKLPATGTIMKNRIPAEANCFSTDKEMMAKGRGTSEQLVRPGEDISLTKWFDNKPIILASTEIGINPESVCRRWDSKNKRYVDVQRPAVVSNYNKYMGGIDLADRMIGHYRSGSKTNKWTVRTIFHFLDLSVSNSWIQYRADQLALGTPKKDIMDMLEFKMTLAGKLLYADTEPNENSENSEEEIEPKIKYSPMPSKDKRLSKSKHMPEICPEKNAHRCRNLGCPKKTKVKCSYCNVFLCLTAERNCYKVFHSFA